MGSSCRSTGRWRKSRSAAFVGPLPAPFATGFFLTVAAALLFAARGFVAVERVRRLVPRVPSLVVAALAPEAAAGFVDLAGAAPSPAPSLAADAATGFAAGFLARSGVLAFPPVRGSFGIPSSLERTPAASPLGGGGCLQADRQLGCERSFRRGQFVAARAVGR